MFDKILIANRGEIAVRVARTARTMGVGVVAVYSDADRMAAHVVAADEAVHIGGAAPVDSYLRGDVIIEAALKTGAQAIHPGYGFLSENPDFVEAVQAAGLIFIGPSAQAIRAMGLKDAAKRLMRDAGVPVVPGYLGDNQDSGHLAAEAANIGYPVLIKAVAGGGGKGMRLVKDSGAFDVALTEARGEAKTAFGNAAVLIEKYIEKPRHIEVQIFGDGLRAVSLFERDCSLQRRHQKVIEEAPAPGMTDEMRKAMCDAAIRAAEAIGYKGAGTVEFIVDGSMGLHPDRFWFMEMNTRLQVEHPVTEAITDIDLVEWQLRIAAGEALPVTQKDLQITGHAFEARLYAEDVPAGFLPATGHLRHLSFPTGVRVDSGVRAGDDISPYYDPMIAKLVTYGPTRQIALTRMRTALKRTQVAGTVTNLGFLGALTEHENFVAGDVDTGLIERDLGALVDHPIPAPADIAWAALAFAGLPDNIDSYSGFTLWEPLTVIQTLQWNDDEQVVRFRVLGPDRIEADIDNTTIRIEKLGGMWRINDQLAPKVFTDGDQVTVFSNYGMLFTRINPLAGAATTGGGDGVICAPMPGFVKEVFVTAGQQVAKGARLAVLEAMKMEHALTATAEGIVAEVLVATGDQVQAQAPVIRLDEDIS